MDFIVTEKSMRPASYKPECFYCKQKIGATHKTGCVLIKKRVLVRMTIDYEICVPTHWDNKQLEFHRNNGSWCANNAIQELTEIFEENNENGCMCDAAHFVFISNMSDPYLDED